MGEKRDPIHLDNELRIFILDLMSVDAAARIPTRHERKDGDLFLSKTRFINLICPVGYKLVAFKYPYIKFEAEL